MSDDDGWYPQLAHQYGYTTSLSKCLFFPKDMKCSGMPHLSHRLPISTNPISAQRLHLGCAAFKSSKIVLVTIYIYIASSTWIVITPSTTPLTCLLHPQTSNLTQALNHDDSPNLAAVNASCGQSSLLFAWCLAMLATHFFED